MKIVFIQKDNFDHLGVMSVGAVMREAGHDVVVRVAEGKDEQFHHRVADDGPDLLCASATTGEHQWLIEQFSKIRLLAPGVPTLLGGAHPTFFPEVVNNEHVDYVCINEGEPCIAEFCDKIDAGTGDASTGNIVSAVGLGFMQLPPLVADLDRYPAPTRDFYYDAYEVLRENPAKHFMASRGCVYNCSFCYNSSLKKLYKGQKMLRQRSPRHMVDEIKAVRERYPLETVRFVDDIFGVDLEWLREFHDLYTAEVGLPYSCFQRADIMTEERARLLRESGCFLVFFAIESGVERLRYEVLKKKISNTHILECAATLRAQGIEIATFNMLGIPGETLDDAWETVRVNIEARADYPIVTMCQPYPKTEMEGIALELGVLDEGLDVDSFSPRVSRKSLFRQKDIRKVQRLHRFFYVAVKVPAVIPVVRLLIRLPLDWIYYSVVFSASHAHRYYRSCKLTPGRFLKDVGRLARLFWS